MKVRATHIPLLRPSNRGPSDFAVSSTMSLDIEPRRLSLIRRRLLAWFDKNKRDLPWRNDRDPYRIWISEVMLQQTQVATVISYFQQFLSEFPTVRSLAGATEQQVLRAWEGLGYYRRARHLHRAAKIIVQDHHSTLPDDPEVWRRLPGVGRYIAGAVLSQAFGKRMPIVEANSARLIARLFGWTGDLRSAKGQKWLWDNAGKLVPANRPGDFNQSLMELGALVCKPQEPHCSRCPLATLCIARRLEKVGVIPRPKAPPSVTDVQRVAVVVRKRGKVLLVRRPDHVQWAGMWEFPQGEVHPGERRDAAAIRLIRDLAGMTIRAGRKILTIRHSVTRFRITLVCVEAQHDRGGFSSRFYSEGKWLSPAQLHVFPVGSAQRKLANMLRAEPSNAQMRAGANTIETDLR